MWTAVDDLIARAPGTAALRLHRLHLIAARNKIARGEPLDPELARDRDQAVADTVAAPLVLARARAAWDGPLVLIKGPEVACDYPAPATRPFGDLDLLTDDAPAAQRALLASGFREFGEAHVYTGIHHLRPLWLPGTPLVVELHTQLKWPTALAPPPIETLLRRAVPSRTGVHGLDALPAAEHALVLAAHAWAHEPLGRAGHLVDVAATLARADPAEVDALARIWDCSAMWRTVARAAGALLRRERSIATAIWARHVRAARERSVVESHLQDWLAPLWLRPTPRGLGTAARAVATDLSRDGIESRQAKLRRTGVALVHASMPRSEHQRRRKRTTAETR
jgi:hypothetical protein